MSERGDIPALKDILEAISRVQVQRYIGSMTLSDFLDNSEIENKDRSCVADLSALATGTQAAPSSTHVRTRLAERRTQGL